MPATVTLGEVKIKANAGKGAYSDWAHETFLKEFLGTSEYAKDCKILNPEALNIEYDQSANKITASSSDFLLIENDALGYNIKYKLDKFVWSSNNDQSDKSIHYEGSVFFQEMKGTHGRHVSGNKTGRIFMVIRLRIFCVLHWMMTWMLKVLGRLGLLMLKIPPGPMML